MWLYLIERTLVTKDQKKEGKKVTFFLLNLWFKMLRVLWKWERYQSLARSVDGFCWCLNHTRWILLWFHTRSCFLQHQIENNTKPKKQQVNQIRILRNVSGRNFFHILNFVNFFFFFFFFQRRVLFIMHVNMVRVVVGIWCTHHSSITHNHLHNEKVTKRK